MDEVGRAESSAFLAVREEGWACFSTLSEIQKDLSFGLKASLPLLGAHSSLCTL